MTCEDLFLISVLPHVSFTFLSFKLEIYFFLIKIIKLLVRILRHLDLYFVTHCRGLTLKVRVLWYVRKRLAKRYQRVLCPSLKTHRLICSKNSYYESALKNRLLCFFFCKERLNTLVGTKDSMLS